MSAGEQSYPSSKSVPALTSTALTGTTASRTKPFFSAFKANEIRVVVTTVVTVTASVVTVNRETLYGVVTSQIAIGTLTIPIGGVAGAVYYADLRTIADTELAPGEGISFTSDGASTAGVVWFGLLGYEWEEGPFPFTAFTAVAKPRSGIGTINRLAFTQT